MPPKDHKIVEEIAKESRSLAESQLAELEAQIDGIKEEAFARGVLSKMEYDKTHNELIKYALLYQLKQKKAYRAGGMTWDEFCVSIGEDRRNVDRIFDDIRPLHDAFSGKITQLLGIAFNKIRYLGKQIGQMSEIDDGCIVFDGEKIPLDREHKEDIEAVIDKMKEGHRKEKDDAEATLKARDRILKEKERVILNQEKELARFKRQLKEKGLEPGEEEFIKQIGKVNMEITGLLALIDPSGIPSDGMSPRMVAEYLECLGYIRRYATALHDTAVGVFGTPEMDGGWKQPGAENEGLEPCSQCKSAHPFCSDCCETCKHPCSAKQTCRLKQ